MKFFEMKLGFRSIGLLCILCASVVSCFSLDREAFTFTSYDLNVHIEPEQHRLGVRGKVTLRNDSQSPQKIAVLQISSSLGWRSITLSGKAGDNALQFITQPYTSDIDHTGALSEALVTLPQAVAPKGTIELEIAYEGVILLDATRLTRIGTPDDVAQSSDWDQIDTSFTGVRGVGYVAWYPIATESANLSESDSLFEVLGRWKAREADSKMRLGFDLLLSASDCIVYSINKGGPGYDGASCNYEPLGYIVPNFVIAKYGIERHSSIELWYLPGHETSAATYAEAAEKTLPLISDWFGKQSKPAKTADLPDPDDAPFESGSLLLTPLANTDAKLAGLAAAHQLTHAAFFSPRPWINEGLAHFAQALYLEQQKGRQVALDYMGLHSSAFSKVEKTTAPRSEDDVNQSLVNTTSEELYRGKAMCVWWMLRDMVGDDALKKALAAYRPEQDKEPSYMPHLIEAQAQRDLEWFFDDWVYHDHGLPDFKIDSVFPLKTATNAYMVTITVDNLGTAGAEVPVTVKFSSGSVMKRIEVRAKNKAVIRVETPQRPEEVIVNDGSVPESDLTNNVFKIEGKDAPK
jgi:hypothetical protein